MGPIPGQFSMLAFGLCGDSGFDGDVFEPKEPREQTFYRELKPHCRRRGACPRRSRLDRDVLKRDGGSIPSPRCTRPLHWVAADAGRRCSPSSRRLPRRLRLDVPALVLHRASPVIRRSASPVLSTSRRSTSRRHGSRSTRPAVTTFPTELQRSAPTPTTPSTTRSSRRKSSTGSSSGRHLDEPLGQAP